jgi:DNA-binding CsgD family transcriptional regulator
MCAFGADLRIVSWNDGAERLTGIPAEEAVGNRCWEVLGGHADDGSLVCHKGCSGARLAREGWPLSTQTLTIKTANGRRRVAVETITSFEDSGFLMMHLMRPAPEQVAQPCNRQRRATLTPRQLEVLKLLEAGIRARGIAERLSLTESTVRNHVRTLLAELGAHSQLEAVYKARCQGLL